ncbi:MAG: SDR family NAD(P)-dependent oxidoreductase [Saprospiraceae bacterium]
MRNFVLITGASSGIGEAACKLLTEKNYEVLACVRNQEDGERLLTLYGIKIHTLIMDVTEQGSIDRAKDLARQIMGSDPMVAIINNAGIVVAGAVLYIPIEEWRRQLDVNVLGVIRVTQAFFEFLKMDDAGDHPRRIINISSVSGLFASPFIGAYAASKFALEALSDSLRRELYMYDIQVVIIEPGNIDTPIWKKAKESEPFTGPEHASIAKFRDQVIESNLSEGLAVDVVADCILKCVRQRRVRPRYLIRAKIWKFKIIRRIPVAWVDKMIRNKLRLKSGISPFQQ